MGDRALIIFTDGQEVSPTVYLHWNATETPKWLEEHKELMNSRGADVQYAAARFIGIAHSHIGGNVSLGCWNTEDEIADAARRTIAEPSGDHVAVLGNHSHGDGGVVVVNANDYSWRAFGGYLARTEQAA